MKVATVSKKWIKPRIPTPPTRQNYYLSFIDQTMSSKNFTVLLLYQSKPENRRQLEESLSEILVEFYPLAGRYTTTDHLIDCSDQGAMFVEADALDVELTMDLIAKNMETHELNNLFADKDFSADAETPLLSIQVTNSPSGGLAIAISVSHKVFDAASLGIFLEAWPNAANPNRVMEFSPCFEFPSMLPHKDWDGGKSENLLVKGDGRDIAAKKLQFDKAALTRLRSKLSPNHSGKTISRVRVVSAVIAKALIGLDRSKHGKTRDFVICHAINMRERTTTPQPKHACGNLVVTSMTPLVKGEEIEMQELVYLMGDAVEKSITDHAEILSPDVDGRDIITTTRGKLIQQMSNPDMINVISFSDWSKFKFYEVDFGWGKPVWVSTRPPPITNLAYFMSNKEGDGIEAWVYLNHDDMHYFEQDQEIMFYTN